MRRVSVFLGVGHIAYVPAFLLTPAVPTPGRVSIVSDLNAWWPWVFAVSGLFLLGAALLGTSRLVSYGHAVAMGAFCGIGAAAIAGFVLTGQRYGWPNASSPVFGIAAVLLAGVHFALIGRVR